MNNLNELTLEELKKRRLFVNVITGVLIGLIVVLFYVLIIDGANYRLGMPIGLTPIVWMMFSNIKKINSEIKKRSEL